MPHEQARHWFPVFAIIIAVAVVPASVADEQSRDLQPNAWEWSLEERLAKRFDPEHIATRDRAYRTDHRGASSMQGGDAAANGYGIDGRRNPELFLPHELFDYLLSGLANDQELRAKQRGWIGPRLRAFGYDDDRFWLQLEIISSSYLAAKHAPDQAPDSDRIERNCLRNAALASSRAAFPRFDEFLYTVIAPRSQAAFSSATREAAQALRRAAERCQ